MADTDIRALVESRATDIEGLLAGSGLTLERFKATVFQLWDKDIALRSCNPNSILSAVMAVADVGLTFTPTLGYAYLVKFGNSATPIIGWRGLVHLALKSGGALDIRAGVRRAGDEWKFQPLHPTEPIVHIPAEKQGPVLGYYAVAFLQGGLVRGEYMDKQAVEKHRDKYSRAAKEGPWVQQFDDMAMKTVVRRICKYLRVSGQLEKAVHLSDSIDAHLGNEEELPPDDLPTPHVEVVKPSAPALKLTADKPAAAGKAAPPAEPVPPATIKGTDIEDDLIKKWRVSHKLAELGPWLMEIFEIDDLGDLPVSKVTECSEAMDSNV